MQQRPLIPSSESSPGSDHYRQSANQAITTVIAAIHAIPANNGIKNIKGMAFNFLDLSILLQNDKAILTLEGMAPPNSDGGRQFKLWLDQFRMTKDGQTSIDLKKMRDLFGGVGGRLHQFGTGNFGLVTSNYDSEVNLFDVITKNKILYVALPTMGKAEAASNFGKMIVGDYRTAVSWVQALPKNERPWPPTLCFFDEAGSYVTQSWSHIFEQARSAHQALVPAVQTFANLDPVLPESAPTGASPSKKSPRICQRLRRWRICKKPSNYHQQILVETKMNCFKRLGKRVSARKFGDRDGASHPRSDDK